MKSHYFHILLALSEGPRHGLGIADEVERQSGGAIRLGPGTLYRSLKELSQAGLLKKVEHPRDDPRRKFYAVTAKGRERVEEQARRLERLVEIARSRQVLPEPGS